MAEGARTRVFRARPVTTSLGRRTETRYALKLLREEAESEPLALTAIRQEAHVGRIIAQRHVVPVLSAHVHRSPFYIVMPLLAGGNVTASIQQYCRVPLSRALWIARQAAEGVGSLHALGYFHGDIIPKHLMITATGHVTLIDLSCARRMDDAPTLEPPAFIGTPQYMAPELFLGRYADARSDFYSLGITLFEMLCGRLPIQSQDLSTIAAFKRDGAMPSVRLFAPYVPTEVADFVHRLTAREPLRRPQSAREVVDSLVRLEIGTLAEQIPA